MKTSSQIAVVNKIDIPVQAIEDYINSRTKRSRRTESKHIQFNAFSCSFENIECCSAYVPVNGVVEISFTDQEQNLINVKIATCCLFTCTKGKNEIYKVAWGTSLS